MIVWLLGVASSLGVTQGAREVSYYRREQVLHSLCITISYYAYDNTAGCVSIVRIEASCLGKCFFLSEGTAFQPSIGISNVDWDFKYRLGSYLTDLSTTMWSLVFARSFAQFVSFQRCFHFVSSMFGMLLTSLLVFFSVSFQVFIALSLN